MFNYLLTIEYEGTNFVGWQSQKNGKSIQDSIEKALKKVIGTKIRITGAGRTDKGVHAYSQAANFKLKKKIDNKKIFLDSINFFLKKKAISILDTSYTTIYRVVLNHQFLLKLLCLALLRLVFHLTIF